MADVKINWANEKRDGEVEFEACEWKLFPIAIQEIVDGKDGYYIYTGTIPVEKLAEIQKVYREFDAVQQYLHEKFRMGRDQLVVCTEDWLLMGDD